MTVAATPVAGVGFDPLRDKTYRATSLGRDVAAFLDWKALGGSSPRTHASIRTTFDEYAHLDTRDVLADLAVIEGHA